MIIVVVVICTTLLSCKKQTRYMRDNEYTPTHVSPCNYPCRDSSCWWKRMWMGGFAWVFLIYFSHVDAAAVWCFIFLLQWNQESRTNQELTLCSYYCVLILRSYFNGLSLCLYYSGLNLCSYYSGLTLCLHYSGLTLCSYAHTTVDWLLC